MWQLRQQTIHSAIFYRLATVNPLGKPLDLISLAQKLTKKAKNRVDFCVAIYWSNWKQWCFSDETLPETDVEYGVHSISSGLAIFLYSSTTFPPTWQQLEEIIKLKQWRVLQFKKQDKGKGGLLKTKLTGCEGAKGRSCIWRQFHGLQRTWMKLCERSKAVVPNGTSKALKAELWESIWKVKLFVGICLVSLIWTRSVPCQRKRISCYVGDLTPVCSCFFRRILNRALIWEICQTAQACFQS